MGAMIQQVGALDVAWMRGLASRRAPRWLDRAFRLLTHLGGATATLLVGVAFVLLPATRDLGLATLIANASSHLVAQILKRRFLRPRPHLVCDAIDPLVPIPDAFSFPSGHACAAMAVATTIAARAPIALGLLVCTMALVVAASRVYLRVHFVTDVVIGMTLGVGGALLGWSIVGG